MLYDMCTTLRFTSVMLETFADRVFQHPLCTSILCIQLAMSLSSNEK